ncbi:hypothetical protein HYZ99_01070 [Candidatus Peregrinibacteria bacterium]|nr:hypothetical protein [Candidatus Peregrinibacteria bacterium]
MSEFGGPDILGPGEGGSRAPEALSEEAKQRFAAAAAGMKAIQREEKKSKKRDSRVAKTIIQFLNDDRYTHLFVLISRLVARDCPSIFILAILSLINDECLNVVQEYLKETGGKTSKETVDEDTQLATTGSIDPQANAVLVEWITRMQMVMALEPQQILTRLMIDEHNIDGTVLQLTTFVLEEFFESPAGGKRAIPFESLHPLTASILQTVFEPFLDRIDKRLLGMGTEDQSDDDDE